MRLNPAYKLRELAGEYMLVPSGSECVDFNLVVSLSESAAWLWKALNDKEFDRDGAVSLIKGEYDVDDVTASSDVDSLFEEWKKQGLIKE